jgi:hypothetical protein
MVNHDKYPNIGELEDELRIADRTGNPAPPFRSTLIGIANEIELAMPYELARGWKSAVARAARLYFLSCVLRRKVTTSKELTRGESARIWWWLAGLEPSMGVDIRGTDRSLIRNQRLQELTRWFLDEETTVFKNAEKERAKKR